MSRTGNLTTLLFCICTYTPCTVHCTVYSSGLTTNVKPHGVFPQLNLCTLPLNVIFSAFLVVLYSYIYEQRFRISGFEIKLSVASKKTKESALSFIMRGYRNSALSLNMGGGGGVISLTDEYISVSISLTVPITITGETSLALF